MRPVEHRLAKPAHKPLADIGLVNEAKDRTRLIRQRDENTPSRRAAHETARSVNRVQHPGQPAGAGLMPHLLAKDRILRAHFGQNRTHRRFCGPVGFGHRVKATLDLVIRHKPFGPKER